MRARKEVAKLAAEFLVEIFQARDHDDRRGDAARQVANRGHGPAEPALRVVEVVDVLQLVEAEDQRDRLDRAHELAQQGDHPPGGAVVRPGLEAAQDVAVLGGKVLAAEVLQHAAAEPRQVGLEVEQGPHELVVAVIEPVVLDDLIGQGVDQAGQAFGLQLLLADPDQSIDRHGPRLGERGREPHQAGGLALGLEIGLAQRVDQVVQDVSADSRPLPRSSACIRNSRGSRHGPSCGRPASGASCPSPTRPAGAGCGPRSARGPSRRGRPASGRPRGRRRGSSRRRTGRAARSRCGGPRRGRPRGRRRAEGAGSRVVGRGVHRASSVRTKW